MSDSPARHADSVVELLSSAQEYVAIISASIDADTLKSLLEAIPDAVPVVLCVRWRLSDLAAGTADKKILQIAHKHKIPVLVCSALNANIYIADSKVRIESAHADVSGRGTVPIPNPKFLTEAEAANPNAGKLIKKLKRAAVPVTEFSQAILDSYAKDMVPMADDVIWLPASMPEQITELLGNEEYSKDAAVDCDMLGLWPGMTDRQIRSQINPQKAFQDLYVRLKKQVEGMLSKDVKDFLISSFSVHPEKAADAADRLIAWVNAYSRDMYILDAHGGGPLVSDLQRIDWASEAWES